MPANEHPAAALRIALACRVPLADLIALPWWMQAVMADVLRGE